jgi:DNA repair protein RadA/Sms
MGPAPPNSGKLASDVRSRRIYWDWESRIPRRELTIVEGDSGVAKSTVITDIGARITLGGISLPDDPHKREPGWFVTLSAEDDGAAVVKPRLVAAGASLERCPILYATGEKLLVDDKEIHELQLPKDVAQIEDWLRWIRDQDAAGPVLVTVDPLVAFIDDTVNTDRDHPTRRAMRPLLHLAKRYEASFLIVRHWVKNLSGRTAATAGGGSGALFNASRASLVVAIHPEDRDLLGDAEEKDPRRRILAGGKSNYGGLARSLEFRLRTTHLDVDGLSDVITARVEWLGESKTTADELVHYASALRAAGEIDPWQEAVEVIREELASGPVQASKVMAAVKAQVGCENRTVYKAASQLAVLKRKEASMSGKWFWALPEHAEQLEDRTKETFAVFAGKPLY